jgi:hypothetical protein
MIPSNIISYFQNFNTDKTANGMEYFRASIDAKNDPDINLDRIDTFFATVGDAFIDIIKNGLWALDIESIRFDSRHTTIFFITGMKCLKNAVLMSNIDIILEFLLSLEYQTGEPAYHELFEMTLLKKIIPLINRQDRESIQEYMGIADQFTSHGIREEQDEKFNKYLQKME